MRVVLGAGKPTGDTGNPGSHRQEMAMRETFPLLGVGVLAQAPILGEFKALKYKIKTYQPTVGSPSLSLPMHSSTQFCLVLTKQ